MITKLQKLVQIAQRNGACKLAKPDLTDAEIIRLFFSPQGREYCLDNNFPSLEQFRRLGDLTNENIYVDSTLTSENKDIALINSHAELRYTYGLHRVILMHGSTAKIYKSDNAVVTIEGEGAEYVGRVYH